MTTFPCTSVADHDSVVARVAAVVGDGVDFRATSTSVVGTWTEGSYHVAVTVDPEAVAGSDAENRIRAALPELTGHLYYTERVVTLKAEGERPNWDLLDEPSQAIHAAFSPTVTQGELRSTSTETTLCTARIGGDERRARPERVTTVCWVDGPNDMGLHEACHGLDLGAGHQLNGWRTVSPITAARRAIDRHLDGLTVTATYDARYRLPRANPERDRLAEVLAAIADTEDRDADETLAALSYDGLVALSSATATVT